MTKDEMVRKIAEECGISIKKAKEALQSFLEGITESLIKKDKVTFTGFGTFDVSERKARTGKNPQTGATIKIAARKAPVFKASKTLKDIIK